MNDPMVILVEDDADVRLGCMQALELEDIPVLGFASVEAARVVLDRPFHGVVVTDIRLPGLQGDVFLLELSARYPHIPVIMITGHGDVATAVKAMREGAYDFVQKPFQPHELVKIVQRGLEKAALEREVARLRERIASQGDLGHRLIGTSAVMARLRDTIRQLAPLPTDILLLGETGTGKDMIARTIHDQSGRSGPFVALNCGGIPEALFESEIFGHEAGAFSGATRRRIGKIEFADKGTLFLDEIESMPLAMQIKLLRVLQERTVERLGANKTIDVDFRIIAASKTNLAQLADDKQFRADLFFRINVATIDIPLLRERRDDIPLLFAYFCGQCAHRLNRPLPIIRESVMAELASRDWLGNVRELRNEAERFVLGMAHKSTLLDTSVNMGLVDAVNHFERVMILEELRRQNYHLSRTAIALQIPKTTLFDKIRKHDIKDEG